MSLNQKIIDEIKDKDWAAIASGIERFLEEQIERREAKGVVLGLSGGIDSAVLAYLCRNMRERTLGIIMPDTSVTPESETGDAQKIVSLTGIEYKLIDIGPIVKEYAMYLEPNERAGGNLRARVRTNILYYYANIRDYLVLGSSDKSEHLIGYFTKFGDGASDVTPIISLYKLQTREIARHLGVPQAIIEKKSSPYLWDGHGAEDELGMSYEEIDSILYCTFEKGMPPEETARVTGIDGSAVRRILEMNAASEHKRLQAEGPDA